jgi:hypothetical protein
LPAKEVNKIVMYGYDALCLEETGARRQNKKAEMSLRVTAGSVAISGLRLLPLFSQGQACKAPRNDKKENHRKIGCVPCTIRISKLLTKYVNMILDEFVVG